MNSSLSPQHLIDPVQARSHKRKRYLLFALSLVLAVGVFVGLYACVVGPFRLLPLWPVTELRVVRSSPCGTWSTVADPYTSNVLGGFDDVAAIADDDIWAIGGKNGSAPLHHWDGERWTPISSLVSESASGSLDLQGIWAASRNDIWAVGSSSYNAVTLHWNGANWRTIPNPMSEHYGSYLSGVAGTATNDIWAVGSTALVMHWDGNAWSVVPVQDSDISTLEISSVAPSARDDAWALGRKHFTSDPPILLHWNGKNWTVATTPISGYKGYALHGLTALTSKDAWAVGDYRDSLGHSLSTFTMHWNSKEWSIIPSPNLERHEMYLHDITSFSTDDVWAVGNAGDTYSEGRAFVMHWDGASWSYVDSPRVMHDQVLNGVAVVAPGEVIAVGGAQYSEDGNYYPLFARFVQSECK